MREGGVREDWMMGNIICTYSISSNSLLARTVKLKKSSSISKRSPEIDVLFDRRYWFAMVVLGNVTVAVMEPSPEASLKAMDTAVCGTANWDEI